jgi:hypothetical protein
MHGSQIGEVAEPEAAAVKTRLASQVASDTVRRCGRLYRTGLRRASRLRLLDAGPVNHHKRNKLG